MEDENIFDEDDALDYIIYEELEKESKPKKSSGCFTVGLIALVVPAALH